MAFSCCSTRRGMFIVGGLNIFIGILCIIILTSQLNTLGTKIDSFCEANETDPFENPMLFDLEYDQFLVKGYFVPSLLTFVAGLSTVIAAMTPTNYMAIQGAYYLHILLFVLHLVLCVLFFILGYHWVSVLGDLCGVVLLTFSFHVVKTFRQENGKKETV